MSLIQRQIPFKNFNLHTAIIPGESEIGFQVGRVDPYHILTSHLRLFRGAVTAAGIPKQNRPIRADQPQSRVVAPPRSVNKDDLEQGLVWIVCNGFHVEGSIRPTAWPIRSRGVNTAHDQTSQQKQSRSEMDFEPFRYFES